MRIRIQIWRDVVAYEGLYQISSKGRIKSLDRRITQRKGSTEYTRTFPGRILRPACGPYMIVVLRRDLKSITWGLHILVCEAFHGSKPTPKHEVNHKNGNKHDNRASNLEWATRSQNVQHAHDIGLMGGKFAKITAGLARACYEAIHND